MSESELRAIDARVHTEVMGGTVKMVRAEGETNEYPVHSDNPALMEGGVWKARDLAHYGAPPPYTTDMAAAWRVVEKLSEGNLFIVGVFRSQAEPVGYGARFGGHAVVGQPTAPLAICLAALAATGAQW